MPKLRALSKREADKMEEKDSIQKIEVDLTGYCISDVHAINDSMSVESISDLLKNMGKSILNSDIDVSPSMFYGIQMAVCDLYAKANKRAQEVILEQDIPADAKEASCKALKNDSIVIQAGVKTLKDLYTENLKESNDRKKSSLN